MHTYRYGVSPVCVMFCWLGIRGLVVQSIGVSPIHYRRSSFYGGIYSKGLLQGFREYIHVMRTLIAQRRQDLSMDPTLDSAGSFCNQYTNLNGYNIDAIDQMRWRYLAAAASKMNDVRSQAANKLFSDFNVINISVTVASIVALQLFYSLLYNRMVGGLDEEIKNVRMLLLLFPDEVSQQVPAILSAGKELLSNSDASSVGSGRGSGSR